MPIEGRFLPICGSCLPASWQTLAGTDRSWQVLAGASSPKTHGGLHGRAVTAPTSGSRIMRCTGSVRAGTVRQMVGYDSLDAALARVRLACGRIAEGAAAIVEAHSFGVPEGSHKKPWTGAYHRRAVRVYAQPLPRRYQHDIGVLFSSSADILKEQSIPATLAEDWVIVTKYLRAASAAIAKLHATDDIDCKEPWEAPRIEGALPMVIRFDALARLTTSKGAERLKQAALAVQQHVDVPPPDVLDALERRLLARVAAGVPIVELASELGYSERSTYRVLANLWKKLDVPGRSEGLERAASEGLI